MKMNEFEYEEVEDDEPEEKEEKLNDYEKWQLLQLSHIKKSTDLGTVDQGFPRLYKTMAATGWVKPVGNGHMITDLGRAQLIKHAKLLRTL